MDFINSMQTFIVIFLSLFPFGNAYILRSGRSRIATNNFVVPRVEPQALFSERSETSITYSVNSVDNRAEHLVSEVDDSDFIGRQTRHRLLNASAEIELGRQIQQLRKIQYANEILAEKLGRPPTLSESSRALRIPESHYCALLELGRHARAELIECNSLLVIKIAHKYHYSREIASLEELIQEGHRGLVRAVDKFDPERGFRFGTYAYWWIRKFIHDAASQKNRVFKISAVRLLKIKKVAAITTDFTQRNNRKPTLNELSALSGQSTWILRNLYRSAPIVMSSDAAITWDGVAGDRFGDLLASKLRVGSVEDDSSRVVFKEAMKELSEHERQVVELRLWLSHGRQLTYREIGEQLGLDQKKIEFMMYRALSKLRHRL